MLNHLPVKLPVCVCHVQSKVKYYLLASLFSAMMCAAQVYTRGIGIYPGDPREYAGPSMQVDANTYRNLALHRPAFQSSAHDYNLTAQLITDGIKDRETGWLLATSTSDRGVLPKNEREVFLDGNVVSAVTVEGETAWVEFDIDGAAPPELDRLDLYLRNPDQHQLQTAGEWRYTVSGSDDHVTWRELGRAAGSTWPVMNEAGPSFKQTISFATPSQCRYYRVELAATGMHTWQVAETVLFDDDREIRIAGPAHFSSAWMSAGTGEEWVYVDLGAPCTFDRVVLSWIRRASEGWIQVSNDASNWKSLQTLTTGTSLIEEIHLAQAAHARYVRVWMTKPANPGSYVLSEFEVFGRGGPVPKPKLASAAEPEGRLNLTGGAWRLQRASLVSASGEEISQFGYEDQDWMIATVPGTVLTSYLNDEAIANPDYGDNQYTISDSFFCADFWYRDEFVAPTTKLSNPHFWLNFNGINWKAEIFLNGSKVGRIDGGFMRRRFDVTRWIRPGARNGIAVRILKNENPGSTKDKAGMTLNGGALGRDNPTFHATAGWDWISTIRGRDIGIWSDVSLTTTGAVTIENPLVTTTLPLPDTRRADITLQATLHNQDSQAESGTLRAQFGTVSVSIPVSLEASASKTVEINPSNEPSLRLANPKLWWPVGYGSPNLYSVKLTFVRKDGTVSDHSAFQTGVRQFTYSEDGDVLRIWINGRRLIPRGGNWGFSEVMLRYRARDYNAALRYHQDMNFNMVRNWVGQIGDEAFYQACDRHGIVVWQDFWLANPWDGPDPNDEALFMRNARDLVLRIRNHPSVGLYCGRNEGFPPHQIDEGLRKLVSTLAPGRHYISSSADGPVKRARALPG